MIKQSNIYNNPFGLGNADEYTNEELIQFWQNPVDSENIEKSIYEKEESIFFSGPRGSGKTMILRYYSYEIQKIKANELNLKLEDHFQKIKGIGLYVMLDKLAISIMKGMNYPQEEWDKIFIRYTELSLCSSLLNVIRDLLSEKCITEIEINQFLQSFSDMNSNNISVKTIDSFIDIISQGIKDINEFRRKIRTEDCIFYDTSKLPYESLFSKVVSLCKNHIKFFENLKFVVLLEQYEDYSKNQQKIINSFMIKDYFSNILFRVSVRPGGLYTAETNNEKFCIEEGKDFCYINTQCTDDFYKQKNFLERIANKRLEKYSDCFGSEQNNIKQLLSDKQEFVINFNEVINKYNVNIKDYIDNMDDCKEKNILNQIIEKNCAEDDIYSHGAYIYATKVSKNREQRLYYSFDAIARLSDGNVRFFLNACERIFRNANFECSNDLFCCKTINRLVQNSAIYEASLGELENHRRIANVGENIYNMIINIGNLFEKYQCDVKSPKFGLRTIVLDNMDDEMKEIIKSCLIWGVLLEKKDEKYNNVYVLGGSILPLFGLNIYTNEEFYMKIGKESFRNLIEDTGYEIKTTLIRAKDNLDTFFGGCTNGPKV